MPSTCEICGKGRMVGRNVSHANNKTQKISKPNLQVVRAKVNGAMRRVKICTRCLRSGKIEKA